MTREKRQVISEEIDATKAEEYFSVYANADARISKIEAIITAKTTEVRSKYQPDLDEQIQRKKVAGDKLLHFATTNSDLFKEKKSIDFMHGTLGYRVGQPKVELTFKKLADVIKAVKKIMPEFIRSKTTETLDKEAIIAERDNAKVVKLFPKMGIEVVQDESFYIEPKTEETAELN